MRSLFNPFDKPIRDITEEDLSILENVSEGWYIEYKGTKPSPKSISKSVSSFANSHGGVYFVGIEADKITNCATAIPGVCDSPDTIRDSVRGHVQPFPYFDTSTIDLSSGKRVIMVSIPEGGNPPYITSDGRVYRRQGAASDPIPETDRYTMDMLYSKARNFEDMVERFRVIDYTFCQTENDTPYLQMFINPKPFNHHIIEDLLIDAAKPLRLLEIFDAAYTLRDEIYANIFTEAFNIVDNIEEGRLSYSGKIDFDTLNTYYDSIAIRNLSGQSVAYNGLTVETDTHGNSKFLIPLRISDLNELDDKYVETVRRAEITSMELIRFLDARYIFGSIAGLISKYCDFMLENNYDGDIEIRFGLLNCWRTTLCFSNQELIKHVEKFGLPICMKNEQYFPDKPLQMNIGHLKSQPIINSMDFFCRTTCALGIPSATALVAIHQELMNSGANGGTPV